MVYTSSTLIQPRMSAAVQHGINNSSVRQCPAVHYPPMTDPRDYEVQVHVNFETRELRLVKVLGTADEADVMLFTRDKCRPDCSDVGCRSCKTRKLYQDKAVNPQGSVPYSPHQEYLYCLRFHQQPVVSLLSLTPREQDVEVKENGILAYWFMKWFERSKILNSEGLVNDLAPSPPPPQVGQQQKTQPSSPVDERQESEHLTETAPQKDEFTGEQAPKEVRASQADKASEEPHQKVTSDYLPNLQIIYQVKKDMVSVLLPKPEQLTRPLDVILAANDEDNDKQQSIPLIPGATRSSTNLVALRNTAYTLKVQLHDQGHAVDLLDFITEQKILRVQESKDSPKQMNFLMERLVEQRGTFVLHITFDERIVEVGARPLGEFYLDVDVDAHSMMIGTVASHASRHYRVEKVDKDSNSNVLLADKQLIFEGGVDPSTLTTKDSIPIERMSDYLITVMDPATKQALPASVLAFQKSALFVKEIKNSDVRLHVTVQRQPTQVLSQSSNANNRQTASPVLAIQRANPKEAYRCSYHTGWSNFRIYHSTPVTERIETLSSSVEPVLQSAPRFSLDVDLTTLKARLMPTTKLLGHMSRRTLFIIYEDSFNGKRRSTPCHSDQAFKLKHWCKYTVKSVEENDLSPLLTFCVTNREIIDFVSISSIVRLAKKPAVQLDKLS